MDLLDILLRTWVNARTTPGGLKVIPQSLVMALEAAGLIEHVLEGDRPVSPGRASLLDTMKSALVAADVALRRSEDLGASWRASST